MIFTFLSITARNRDYYLIESQYDVRICIFHSLMIILIDTFTYNTFPYNPYILGKTHSISDFSMLQ